MNTPSLMLGLIGGALIGALAGVEIIAPAMDMRPIQVVHEWKLETGGGHKCGCLPVVRTK